VSYRLLDNRPSRLTPGATDAQRAGRPETTRTGTGDHLAVLHDPPLRDAQAILEAE
jgi:hypothetical protein